MDKDEGKDTDKDKDMDKDADKERDKDADNDKISHLKDSALVARSVLRNPAPQQEVELKVGQELEREQEQEVELELEQEREQEPQLEQEQELEQERELELETQQEVEYDLELVLIRHGHTQWNKERRYLGSTDLPLLPEARQQLSALSDQSALGGEFWRVYCSDLLRCRETLAAVAPHLERQAIYDSQLRELDFGAWEGGDYEQLKDNGHYRSWIDHPELVTPPEGEAWEQFEARVDDFWTQLEQELEHTSINRGMPWIETSEPRVVPPAVVPPAAVSLVPDSSPNPPPPRVLIVTHGGIIRLLLARLTEGVTFYTVAAPAPGEVTVLNLRKDEGAWRMMPREV
ncbi:histidine phosphatase family protein [Paenibacillus phytohabitans]